MCSPKSEGGMGFRNFKYFNDALLAKQGWRLATCQDSLMSRCLKARYFPRLSFVDAPQGRLSSYTWRSVQQAGWIIKRGSYWRVGNGCSIKIWEHNWIPSSHN